MQATHGHKAPNLADDLAVTVRLMVHSGVPEAAAADFLGSLCSALIPDIEGMAGE